MKTILSSTVFVVVGVIAAFVGIYLERSWSQKPVDPTQGFRESSSKERSVHALGSIQPSGGVIEIAVPAGLRALRFEERVKVGQPVKKGEPLAYLDGYEERRCEVDVINEEIKAAERNLQVENDNERSALVDIDRELDKNVRLGRMQLDSFELKIKCLQEKYELSRKQREAVEGLQKDNTISDQEYQQRKVQEELSLGELKYAQAEKERQQKELDLTTSAEAIERQKRKVRFAAERARALFPIETLRAKRALAEAGTNRCTVVAPVDGTVLEVTTLEGESAVGKPLLKLGDTRKLYVMAEVYTDDREGVQVNQKAKVQGRGLLLNSDVPLVGKVERISPVVGGHKQSPLDPTYRENARVYDVWIKLDLDDDSLKAIQQRILQPVDVTIEIDSGVPAGTVAERRS
jgi:HlyD family secretion protein